MEKDDPGPHQEIKIMARLARLTTLLVLIGLTGCVSPGIKTVTSSSELGDDEILIVGKIQLVPKYNPSEQKLPSMMFNKDMVRDKVFIAIDSEFKPMDDYATYSGVEKLASVDFRKTFMVAANKTQPLIFSGAFFMISAERTPEYYYLPGGLKLNYDKNDKAIYIGTIEFHRNEYDEITKVRIIDQYKEANAVFKKVHGKKYALRRIKPVVMK